MREQTDGGVLLLAALSSYRPQRVGSGSENIEVDLQPRQHGEESKEKRQYATAVLYTMQHQLMFNLLAWLGVASAFLTPPFSQIMLSVPSAAMHTCRYASQEPTTPSELHFRPAAKTEQGTIQQILVGMLMNPMSIDISNFICAEQEGALVGFGQVRSVLLFGLNFAL